MSEADEPIERAGDAGEKGGGDNEPSPEALGVARARKLGKRYAMLLFVGFAAGFILLSTWEIVASVFSLDAPGGVAAHGKLSDGCAAQLRIFAAAIDPPADRAFAPSLDPNDPSRPSAENGSVTVLNKGALDSACTSSADLDALAAARRYERAVVSSGLGGSASSGERAAGSARAEAIAPLRHDVEAYLAR